MMTSQEMQSLIAALQPLYTDVRLLDAEAVYAISEGKEAVPDEKVCYASEHTQTFSHHCAAKQALTTKGKQCRIEVSGSDVLHITACYYEVDGKPYVLEMIQRSPCQSTLDSDIGEHMMRELSGYNIKLYRDAMTGAYNRRYYEEVACKISDSACVAIMDLDDFKICNDTYGHHAGDLALEAASAAIRSCIRDNDILIRYGGDEFLLILEAFPGDYLQLTLERIRTSVQASKIPSFPHLHLSMSIGGIMKRTDESMDSAIQRADRLMYQAKMHKNTVFFSASSEQVLDIPESEKLKAQILIIDDSEFNRELLSEILSSDYHILEAENGEKGLEQLQAHHGEISLVLLDINMPVMDGFSVLRAMNASHAIEDVPVIMISSEDSDNAIRQSYELGASDYINRPFDSKVVYRRVVNTIKLYAKQRRLIQLVSDQIRAREKSTTMLVGVLSQIVEFRNGESGSHVRHIQTITELLLNRLLEISTAYDISAEKQEDIPLASALHDIGKIAIDENILNKPAKLTPTEFEAIKKHSVLGADMLHKLENFDDEPLLRTAYEIARWHHERWDGRGYPDGLVGDEIPISAQIVSLADVYDALTSKRCYKEAFSHERAIQMILSGECGSFNPLLLQCLTDIQPELLSQLRTNYQ